jgi:hypothetical protein
MVLSDTGHLRGVVGSSAWDSRTGNSKGPDHLCGLFFDLPSGASIAAILSVSAFARPDFIDAEFGEAEANVEESLRSLGCEADAGGR